MKLLLPILAVVVLLCGCSATSAKIKNIQQKAVMSLRKPGDDRTDTPDNTAKFFSCSLYKTNKLILVEMSVLPDKIAPGREINQRIRYAFCPFKPAGTEHGKIIRSILYNSQTVFEDTDDYEFKPGSWTVDAFIEVPREAQNGEYQLQVTVAYSQERITRSTTFRVKSE